MSWILEGLVVVALDGTVYFPELRDHVLRLRTGALGSYKQLLFDTATMAGMLKYLTGFQNTKQHPNQNYARELMELFTLGRVHPVTGAPNYTELDVQEIVTAKLDGGFAELAAPIVEFSHWFGETFRSSSATPRSASTRARTTPRRIRAPPPTSAGPPRSRCSSIRSR